MRAFLDGWYADIPPSRPARRGAFEGLPTALAVFYELVTRRREIYGVHNKVYPPHELAYDGDHGGVPFAAENQGVWVKAYDPDKGDDPPVYDDREPDPEPLSGVLLQFVLIEAVMSAPYTGYATITEEQRDRFLAGLTRVPLHPSTFLGEDTTLHVAHGLVAASYPGVDGFDLWVGSRQGTALRPLREPGFAWKSFNG